MTNMTELRMKHMRMTLLEAGEIALDFYKRREKLSVNWKSSPQDLVSAADKAVEDFARSQILMAFPEDSFLGEEDGHKNIDGAWMWVMDPIDGTAPFVNGLDSWCLSLALLNQGEIVGGMIYQPVTDQLFHATKHQGAFVNDTPLSIHTGQHINEGLFAVGLSHKNQGPALARLIGKLLEDGGMFIRHGSGALSLAQVASGRLLGYYEAHIMPWDCLAGLILIREAGGWTNDYLDETTSKDQAPILQEGRPILGLAPGIVAQIHEILRHARLEDQLPETLTTPYSPSK